MEKALRLIIQMKTVQGDTNFQLPSVSDPLVQNKVCIFLMLFVCTRGCDTGSLNATLAKGNVILCFQTHYQRFSTTAIRTVLKVGGVGLIFAKSPSKDVTESVEVPCVEVDFVTGTSLLTYMVSTR